MDTFKTFMNIFERAVEERNSTNLTSIVRDGRRYFQNIAKNDSELVLSTLFDTNKGLLSFLNNELKRSVRQKGFDTATKETFHLLEFVMEQFVDVFDPYIIEAKITCQQALTTQCSALTQRAACSAFNKLIVLFKEYDINLGETVKKFVSLFHLVNIKERSMFFSVLGTIMKHNNNQEVPEIQEFSHIIFRQLRNDFKKQYQPQNMTCSIDIFQVYLDVLSDMFEELPSETKETYFEEIYRWVKELSHPEKYSVKKVSMRAAVNLLSRHIYQFREFIYRDYEYWYKLLANLSQDKNVQCSECGQRALKNFYRIIGTTLKLKTSEDDKLIFLYFKNHFEEQLKNNHHVNSNMLRFIVYGFSQMAAPCKRYLTNEDVKNMFSLIANCAMPLCSRDDLDKASMESICDYQEALSEIILHTSDLSIDQINIITKLSVLLIKRFPDLRIVSQNVAISSLIKTIINVGLVSKNLSDEFLHNLIHNGVIWTCSHTLFVDAELKRGLENLAERPKCYKNYLPLWLQVSKPNRYKEHSRIAQDLVDSIIKVGIALISKLNLKTKTKENTAFSDATFSQIAENEADFGMFINIVDLYVDVINKIESPLLINTIHTFILKVISMSYKHSLVSGFYKLIRATFKHICNFGQDEIEADTLEMLYKYLMNVLNLIPTFSNELLTTCLDLILNVPMMYVERILSSTVPAFKIAFTVGLSDFELACAALNALEKWANHLDNRHTNAFLREIVSFLEPYLQSGESSVELHQDIIKTERKVIKQIILKDDENTLERFQMRVLLFISSLDTDIIMHFIYKKSMDTGATWDKKDLLKYSLTLSDTQVDIHFDKILPRLILLAQNSGDRRTKIIACEVLHSIIAFILGKTSQQLTSNPDRFVPVYVTLCPALLRLGCDYDEAARQIFQPLMLQLTHWLSSKFMLKSLATVHFLDSLFEGLSNESNSSLREFAGMCLAEFTKWSIRQSDDDRKTQFNIHEIIHKMTNFALHPSISKRIAAATAFNHLYTILREDERIVSVYWFDILYSFVKSLDGCNDPSIIAALDHVERVLIVKKNLLNAEHRERKKPHEFEGATLVDAVSWLLVQCGSLDQRCRTKCMELVVKLSPHVANYNSVETMISNYIESHGIDMFNLIILNNLKAKAGSLSSNGMLHLLRSLDCYIWLIKGNLLDAQCLFGSSNSQREIIFNCTRNFVHVINRIKVEEKEEDWIMLSKEFEDLQTLQCKTLLTVFDFMQILLNLDEHFIPDFFFNTDLFEVIGKCVMSPHLIGFDAKNLEITEALPSVMGNLFHSLMRENNSHLLYLIKDELSIHLAKHISSFVDLNKIVSSVVSCTQLKQYVRGLSFLKQHNILDQLGNVTELNEQLEDKVTCIFKILAKECMGELVRVNIRPSIKYYLEILMEFLLMQYQPSMTTRLIELIENDTMLGPDNKKIEHGIYFLNTFKDEIFRYMLKDTEKTMPLFNDVLQRNPSLVLLIMEQLFLFVQRYKKELHDHTELLADNVIKNFTSFESVVNNIDDRKHKLISTFRIAVRLKRRPTEVLSLSKDFYSWILNQLIENADIEYKVHILQSFLVCLTDMTSDTKPELLAILRSLKNNRLDVCPNDFSQGNVKASKITNCYQALVSLLPITRSVTVFESVILFASGIAEQLCNEKTNEYLQKYYVSITTDYALLSLQSAYKLFINVNTSSNERFDVLRRFLLPSFDFCRTAEIHLFYEKNIKEIHNIICQGFVGTSSDKKELVISKIGCYDLVAIMFAKVHVTNIVDTESAITRNAIDNVVTGKELLQSLYSKALNVRILKTSEPEHKEVMRLLHCSAYNCSIAIVSSLKKDEDSYMSIFAENKGKGQLLWENIVDCQRRYNFQQTVKEYPKYSKKLINIRKCLKQKQASSHYSYIHSYDLSTSTLKEDINAYDFNETVVHSKPDGAAKEGSMSLTFENDDLNNHECMASICGVLKHMLSEEISVPSTDDDIAMPKWLKCFFSSITSTTCDNVRLYMLKVVLNMQIVFKPYAKFFLGPIMRAAYSYLKENQLNYIIFDVIEMLIDWQTASSREAIESTLSKNKAEVQKLWEIIIQKVIVIKTHGISRSVYKYNMNMVKVILEVWSCYLKLPANLSDKMKAAPGPAVYLILICFVNGMEKEIIQNNDILQFLEKSLENWQDDEETIIQCCECMGLILKLLGEDEASANRKCALIDKIRSIFRQMQTQFESRQMKCIRAVCKNYPTAAMIYFEFVPASMFRVDAQGKSNCLEIFLVCIPSLTVDQILKELAYMKFRDLLENRILPCERIAFKIIDTLVPILPASNILSLASLALPYANHEYSDYRESLYNIFISIYKKYATDTSGSNDVAELLKMSKEILLNALLDSAEKLQEMILDFWTQDAQLTNTCNERLLEALNTYTPSVGQNFLPFVLLLILDLTKKSRSYTQKLFEPLYECSYRDYKIALSWRTKNLGSKAPLFAPSLTSQMNQTFTQMSAAIPNTSSDFTFASSFYDSNVELELRATQEAVFEPTYVNNQSTAMPGALEEDDTFKVPKVPEPAHNKKSKRFLSSASDLTAVIRQKEIKKNILHAEMIREEGARQRSSVKLFRKYRIGDFPDIEISHAALVEPLQQLAKKDSLICKDLTVSIVCSLLKHCRSDSFVEKLADSMKYVVENEENSNPTVTAVLEILLNTRITNCSPEAVARVSRSNSLNFLGSLVLEENLIYGSRPIESPKEKRIRREIESESSSEWLQLTNLYESMNDIDIVLSIFQNHITDEDMQIASLAQASNNWMKAKSAYEKAYETESEVVKEHCLQGLFECLGHLCCWDEVDRHVKRKLNGQLDNIWNDPWKDWMFPWLFEAHVRKLINKDYNDEFNETMNVMQCWLSDDTKVKHMKRFFGEESSMFLLRTQIEVARDFLLNTMDELREQWIRLHPLSTQLRVHKLRRIRIINDVDQFIKTLRTAKDLDKPCDLSKVLKFWSNSMPSAQDAILPWDKLISYRIYFVNSFLTDKLQQWDENLTQSDSESIQAEEGNEISHSLRTTTFNMRLKMIEAALTQRNKYIGKKYLRQLEQNEEHYSLDMKHQFFLTGARIKYLNGDIETDMEKKLSNYTSSWKYCHNLLQEELEGPTSVNARRQISKIASKIVELSEENGTFSELLTSNSTILKEINVESTDLSAIRDALDTYSFNHLKACCDTTTTNIRECYFILSKYCYENISRGTNNAQLSKEFVRSILKAMSYGSLEAAHYFPCLLKPEYFHDQETKDIFMNESEGVQTWLFLSWQAQLFSNLGTSIAPLVVPILKRIVETYPSAVFYTFRLTVETNPALLNEPSTYEIRKILYNNPEIDRFLLAMQYLVQPELYLQYYLSEFVKNLALGTATAVDILLKKVYPNTRENKGDPKPGCIFSEIAKYKSKIKELENKKPEEIKLRLVKIIESVKELLQKRKDRYKLQDYSPWLVNFHERGIEIPGQYTGNRKPMPQYHARIIKFEPTVKVMQSMRKPIRITMIGNDAKEYHFLVKFGEDLRQDQRLQQLFTVMNKTLYSDAACRQRQLSIDTYQVIPLSRTVGLIQWVNNTRSLQELIHFTLSKEEIGRYDSIPGDYREWMRNAAPSKKQHEWYKEATQKYGAHKVLAKMNEFIGKTKWDSLRKTLTVLCPSIESFVTLRRNLITSYGTMCVAHWILGIGDRHPQNTLIAIDSGRCLGIDFGLAFDAGVDQRIPELMPFRLTPQILGLLKPFTEKDLLGTVMIHALRAVRNEQGPVLSCLDVFVHEPLNWTEHINRGLRENVNEDLTDIKWVPIKKINAVTKKLNGIKPSLITLQQLKEQHNDKYFDRYYAIVTGDDDVKRTRARMKDNLLTPEEQVVCLLDQATDLNILGHTFVGWKPWL